MQRSLAEHPCCSYEDGLVLALLCRQNGSGQGALCFEAGSRGMTQQGHGTVLLAEPLYRNPDRHYSHLNSVDDGGTAGAPS